MIQYRALGRSDLQVSSIGMGCVTFGREIDRETSFHVLDHALASGITLFDTAEAYGGGASELLLGEWMTERRVRDQVVLATKVSGRLSRQRVISSAEESLRRLQADQIDLFQLHIWDEETPLEETLSALTELVQQGKVRHVGCSNWSAEQLSRAQLLADQHGFAPLQSVQPPYNLVERDIEEDLLPLCADQQIGVLSYSPLAAGFLTGKYRRGQPIPAGTRFDIIPDHQLIYCTDHGFETLERLETDSEKSSCSMVQLALAWVMSQSSVTSVLIGARNTSQVDQALEAAGR
jgi:aryl-alcohol dehydrogenase-like predicted oxidoreductase